MLDAPVPIAATIATFTRRVTVTFDKPLAAGILDPANWSGTSDRTGPFLPFTPTDPPFAFGSDVTFIADEGLPGPGPNRVDYAPPPFDVVSDFGFVEAPAIAAFPLVVV